MSLVASTITEAADRYVEALDRLDLRDGVEAAMSIVSRANALVDEEAPWGLAKDESKADRLDRVLYDLAESCRCAAILLSPVMPTKMAVLLEALNSTPDGPLALEQARPGGLVKGTQLTKGPGLFPRIELETSSE